MQKSKKFIQLAKQYKGFSIVLALEIVVLVIMFIMSFKRSFHYILDNENLIVNDSSVYTDENGALAVTGINDEQTFSRYMLTSDKLPIPWGMYELKVNYNTIRGDLEYSENSCENYIGIIQMLSGDNPTGFRCDNIFLHDGFSSTRGRLWVRSLTGIQDLEVKVCFLGMGELHISNIEIKELWTWRIIRILACLLLLLFIDSCYIYFFTNNTYQDKGVVLGLFATIILSSLPLFTDYILSGHDLGFHLTRIWSLGEGLKAGHLIVPIQTQVNNGYGYATPLFYSQLFLYVPAVLYCMGVPLQICYHIYALLCNTATCLICYYCVGKLFKDKRLAVFASFLYTCSAYRICNLYVRATVGEYTAMIFIPLILYGFMRVYLEDEDKITWRDYLPIVAGLSGLIQCHILSCEIAGIFIVIFCILYIRKTLQPKRLLVLVKAALLTVIANIGFLLPLLQSMQMDIQVRDTMNRIQAHGIYLLQLIGIMMPVDGGSDNTGMYGDMSLTIGFPLLIGLSICVFCYANRYKWQIHKDKMMQVGAACMGFTILSIIWSMRFFPWDSLYQLSEGLAKMLCTIQFPWRYLAFGTGFCVLASCVGIKYLEKYVGTPWRNAACGAMLILLLINLGNFYMGYSRQEQSITVYGGDIYSTDMDMTSSGEYFLNDTTKDTIKWRNIITEDSVTVENYEYSKGVTTFWCKNTADTYKNVEIPLLNYDNYHAYALANEDELSITNSENSFVCIAVSPNYEGMVQVKYEIPLLWKLSYVISFITVAGIVIFAIYDIRFRKKKGKK